MSETLFGTQPAESRGLHEARLRALAAADATLTAADTAHAAAANPHPVYATDADLTAHTGAADPHTGYVLDADMTAALARITALENPSICHVYATAHATTTTGVDLAVAFNNERRDTAAMHSTVTNNTRVHAVISGWHHLAANIAFASNATGFRVVWFRRGGSTNMGLDIRSAVNGDLTSFMVATEVYLNAGEYIEVMVKQNSGGNLALAEIPDFSPEFKMSRIGNG